MHVGGQNTKWSYNMEGNSLCVIETEKDLGIWISSDMKCLDHCLYAFNKASKIMELIKRTIKYKETEIMVSLYKTLLRPHVEYCVSAWSPYYKKDKELLEKVECRFTKIIVNMEGLRYEERLRCLKLWTLEERRNRQDLRPHCLQNWIG